MLKSPWVISGILVLFFGGITYLVSKNWIDTGIVSVFIFLSAMFILGLTNISKTKE